MSKESAFIDFYNEKNIIPVGQNINAEHFRRRNYLYSSLGINLSSIKSSKIIEFGPGGGYNAQATCKWHPAKYTFVDASKRSLDLLHKKKDCGEIYIRGGARSSIQIIESTILSFSSDELFDLVLVEGLLPGQTHPEDILKHSSSFTDIGGIYITTTTSAISLLSDTCRKIFLPIIEETNADFDSQIKFAMDIFSPQLQTLGNGLRSTKDWVLDTILRKASSEMKYIFSMKDVIGTIGCDFQFHGSSPRFLIDDRFYKHVTNSDFGINEILLNQFEKINVSFIDHKLPLSSVSNLDMEICKDIELLSKYAWDIHLNICSNQSYETLDDFLSIMNKIEKLLPDGFEITKESINDFCLKFPKFLENLDTSIFSSFNSWWGRGQQYISLIRNPNEY